MSITHGQMKNLFLSSQLSLMGNTDQTYTETYTM